MLLCSAAGGFRIKFFFFGGGRVFILELRILRVTVVLIFVTVKDLIRH